MHDFGLVQQFKVKFTQAGKLLLTSARCCTFVVFERKFNIPPQIPIDPLASICFCYELIAVFCCAENTIIDLFNFNFINKNIILNAAFKINYFYHVWLFTLKWFVNSDDWLPHCLNTRRLTLHTIHWLQCILPTITYGVEMWTITRLYNGWGLHKEIWSGPCSHSKLRLRMNGHYWYNGYWRHYAVIQIMPILWFNELHWKSVSFCLNCV